jgi:hypothetical protein
MERALIRRAITGASLLAAGAAVALGTTALADDHASSEVTVTAKAPSRAAPHRVHPRAVHRVRRNPPHMPNGLPLTGGKTVTTTTPGRDAPEALPLPDGETVTAPTPSR